MRIKRIKYLLTILFLLFFGSSYSQIIERDYSSFGKKLVTMKEFNLKSKDGITQKILFLGELTTDSCVTYKVFVSFIDYAGKGVNDLIFLSNKKQYIYRLDIPDDAPIKISFNRLYFKKNKEVKHMKLSNDFHDLFCSPFECFPIVR